MPEVFQKETRLGEVETAPVSCRRLRRRWRFASAEFDELSWTLIVHGVQAQAEMKPLQILHELLSRSGEVVTKAELLDAVWPDVTVVEASLSTAIAKLRRALGADGERIIVTVPRLGYRVAVPIEIDVSGEREGLAPELIREQQATKSSVSLLAIGVALLALTGVAIVLMIARPRPSSGIPPPRAPTRSSELDALRTLDLSTIERLLSQGWDPNAPFDAEGNGALNILLNICEWNPAHDKQKMLVVARTLFEAGARLDAHNKWGDTPYSIAVAPRYCGRTHPVTQMIRRLCTEGYQPLGNKCLATYKRRW